MKDDFYKWSEFKAEAFGLLPLESSRLIQGDDGQYMNRLLKLAVLDLQKFVPVYRLRHEAIFLPSDFVAEGSAGVGMLPPNAKLRDVWMYDYTMQQRHPVTEMAWEDRFQMVHAAMNLKDNNGRIAIDHEGYTFYVYPVVRDGWGLSVFWDGLKTEFQENEETPFDTLAVEAAAEYISGKLARPVQGDLNLYNSYFHPQQGSYTLRRKDCYLNAKERTRVGA